MNRWQRAANMRADHVGVALRERSMFEAADLGVRLVQRHARSFCRAWLPVCLAVTVLAASCMQLGLWAPILVFMASRAWMDRTALFVASRAALGQETRLGDVLSAWRSVWASQLLLSFLWRPLSPWRAFTQPIYQLEGLQGKARRQRKGQLARGYRAVASLWTGACCLIELSMYFGLLSLLVWFAPPEAGSGVVAWFFSDEHSLAQRLLGLGTQALVFAFIEPFYVAGGFAMYLNRRVQLEAWDIEQTLRRVYGDAGGRLALGQGA